MHNQRIAAIFDVDGTLLADTSLEAIFARWLWWRGELRWRQALWMIGGGLHALYHNQSPSFANKFYLRGQDTTHIARQARECFAAEIAPRLLPRALERIDWHRRAGHFVVLLSGGLDVLVAPLAEALGVHARIATRLESKNGKLTGRIAGEHFRGAAKATALRALSEHGALNLQRSFAYADHHTDQSLLALVGHPVATNADARLRRLAIDRNWMVEDFRNPFTLCLNSTETLPSTSLPLDVSPSPACSHISMRPTG